VLGDEAGGHAFECGEVETAAQVEFTTTRLPGIAGAGGGVEDAQGVLHGAPSAEEALVGGVVLGPDGPGGLVGCLGHRFWGGPFVLRRDVDRSTVAGPVCPSVGGVKVDPHEGRWDGWMGLIALGGIRTHLRPAPLVFVRDEPDARAAIG